MTLDNGIAELLTYAERYLGLNKRDELYARNRILSALGISSYGEGKAEGELPALPDGILQNIFDCLEREGVEFDPAVLGGDASPERGGKRVLGSLRTFSPRGNGVAVFVCDTVGLRKEERDRQKFKVVE